MDIGHANAARRISARPYAHHFTSPSGSILDTHSHDRRGLKRLRRHCVFRTLIVPPFRLVTEGNDVALDSFDVRARRVFELICMALYIQSTLESILLIYISYSNTYLHDTLILVSTHSNPAARCLRIHCRGGSLPTINYNTIQAWTFLVVRLERSS